MNLLDGDMAKSENSDLLLTIAIPTYNRSKYLDQCLGHICSQLEQFKAIVEIIVSNNNSEDDTETVVNKYLSSEISINYVKNTENIGAEKNVIQCFNLARGKYVLILGDDDLLLEGSLCKIINILNNGEYGVVYLSSYGFWDDYVKERPASSGSEVVIYSELEEYIRRVNYWVTFLSGNIVNKSIIRDDVDPAKFVGSNLPQLNWILSAMFRAQANVYVAEYSVAFKTANTGGYKVCEVFAVNLNRIFDSFIEQGVDKYYFSIINNALLRSFFPSIFMMLRKNKNSFSFIDENYTKILSPVFKNYPYFWIVTYPIIKLPNIFAKIYYKLLSYTINR